MLNEFIGSKKSSAADAYWLGGFNWSGGFRGALADAEFNMMWIRYPKRQVARDYTHYMNAELRANDFCLMR